MANDVRAAVRRVDAELKVAGMTEGGRICQSGWRIPFSKEQTGAEYGWFDWASGGRDGWMEYEGP